MDNIIFNYYKELISNYNNINNDWDRLKFLKKYNDIFMVILDNDATYVGLMSAKLNLNEPEIEIITKIELKSFDNYHYWSDGCLLLFEFAGITAEQC